MRINSVLIANRGEIAIRIMRTLSKMQIKSVCLFTGIESEDWYIKMSDDSAFLGEGTLEQTWLNIPLIIDIAKQKGVDAIHPGYGFLSENAEFARQCEESGILFIGPQSHVIHKMGSKTIAAQYAREAQIPLLPRMEGSHEKLIENGSDLGFPILVKAAAGGGGKGMIKVEDAALLEQSIATAAAQAKRYFSDDTLYLEKFVEHSRHLEVQILSDNFGNTIHLFERECTLQRNHQKVIEEAPSVSITPEVREKLLASAITLASAVGYRNAGTVEFIIDKHMKFYFLEMNTRIQVEHPVTELITGVDLVEQQIRIAEGKPLEFDQKDILSYGHAIETRLYAEDPSNGFKPSPGYITKLQIPHETNVRVDSAINNSGKVHANFDAMVAKIIVHHKNRGNAIYKLNNTLNNTLVHGIESNITLLRNITEDPIFIKNNISSHSIAEHLQRWSKNSADDKMDFLVAALFLWLEKFDDSTSKPWRMAGKETLHINKQQYLVYYHPIGNTGIHVDINGEKHEFNNITIEGKKLEVSWASHHYSVNYSSNGEDAVFLINGANYHIVFSEVKPMSKIHLNGHATKIIDLKASLFGRVLRINVSENQKVNTGDPLLVLESMKMENTILAPGDRIISKVNVKEGDQVIDGQSLIFFEP